MKEPFEQSPETAARATYECPVPDCGWRNPNWRLSFTDATVTYFAHRDTHGVDA